MAPRLAAEDSGNLRLSEPEPSGNTAPSLSPGRFADGANVIGADLRPCVSTASRGPSFPCAVSPVVRVRANEQMAGVDACRIVAPVTDDGANRDIDTGEAHRNPVRFVGSSLDGEPTISLSIDGRSPEPAARVRLGGKLLGESSPLAHAQKDTTT